MRIISSAGERQHDDCDYVKAEGSRISLAAVGADTFAFNASVYTQEELTEKAHNYELKASPYTVFCLDYRQNGIGSNSCGPRLLEKYRFDEMNYLCNQPASGGKINRIIENIKMGECGRSLCETADRAGGSPIFVRGIF